MQVRIAILKKVGEEWIEVVPGYGEEGLLSRILSRTNEGLLNTETYLKHKWNKKEVLKITEVAVKGTMLELKEETIPLKTV